MTGMFSRTELLLGKAAMEKLAGAHVAVFGIGGVGGYVTEALARSGVGELTLVDRDVVEESNLNRQIIATRDTIGRYKVEAMEQRIHSIHPEARVHAVPCFFLPDTAEQFPFSDYDYVVDAVDTVTAKIELILQAKKWGVPIISSMGTGNKLEPARLEIADVFQTSVCPLARVMRHELKKRGITDVKVVYSKEEPLKPIKAETEEAGTGERGKDIPGSTAFVPAAAGLLIAAEVVRDLVG